MTKKHQNSCPIKSHECPEYNLFHFELINVELRVHFVAIISLTPAFESQRSLIAILNGAG